MATLGELVKLVDARFGHAKLSGLHDRVLELFDEQVERTKLETHERIRQTLDLDKWPFTKNEHYFASYRVTYLNKYKKARSVRMPSLFSGMLSLIPFLN